jgi:hypothetical protein
VDLDRSYLTACDRCLIDRRRALEMAFGIARKMAANKGR